MLDRLSDGKDTVTDFQTGAGGDALDIHQLLAGFGGGSNADDFVHLVESGGNTTAGSMPTARSAAANSPMSACSAA